MSVSAGWGRVDAPTICEIIKTASGAEAFLLMAVVASMYYRCWALLPVIGALGILAKESFAPFSIAMALAWYFASSQKKGKPSGSMHRRHGCFGIHNSDHLAVGDIWSHGDALELRFQL